MEKKIQKKMGGFTMIEIITTLGIFLILAGLTLPIGLDFYRNQKLNAFSHLFADRIEKARVFARSQKGDSSWGGYVGSDTYTIFKGDSFNTRDQSFDQNYRIPEGISVNQDEVVFEKLTGHPNQAVSFNINGVPRANAVSISSTGRVRLDLDVSLEGN